MLEGVYTWKDVQVLGQQMLPSSFLLLRIECLDYFRKTDQTESMTVWVCSRKEQQLNQSACRLQTSLLVSSVSVTHCCLKERGGCGGKHVLDALGSIRFKTVFTVFYCDQHVSSLDLQMILLCFSSYLTQVLQNQFEFSLALFP